MKDEIKVELTARALFLLFDVVEMYVQEGWYSSESLEEARKRLKELDEKIKGQDPLKES